MRIVLTGLEFYGYHGVTDDEQRLGRRFLVNADLEIKSEAQDSDAIRDTVDYNSVALRIIEVGQATKFRTLERLTAEMAQTLMAENPRIERVTITVTKPYPPIHATVEWVGVTHELRR